MLHPYYWSNDCCICMMLLFWHTQCNRWDLYLRGSHCWGLPCPLDPIVSPPTYAPRVILFCHKGLWSDTLTESIILPWIERSYPHQWCEEFTNEASCLFSMCHWMYRQPHLERRKTWNIFSDSQSSFAVNQKYLVLFISQRKWYTWEVQVMQNLKTGTMSVFRFDSSIWVIRGSAIFSMQTATIVTTLSQLLVRASTCSLHLLTPTSTLPSSQYPSILLWISPSSFYIFFLAITQVFFCKCGP